MKSFLTAFLMAMATMGLSAMAVPATGVKGTAHDLSITGENAATLTVQVCVFCHTPHNAAAAGAQLIPLWNKATTASLFTMYNYANNVNNHLTPGLTIDASPQGVSLACLSCHDGTLAVGDVLNAPDDGGNTTYNAAYTGLDAAGKIIDTKTKIGTDLSNDHPIGITYRDDLNMSGPLGTAGLNSASGLTLVKLFPTNATGSKVQCASCHDVHNHGVDKVTAPFLRDTMVSSKLCSNCHIK